MGDRSTKRPTGGSGIDLSELIAGKLDREHVFRPGANSLQWFKMKIARMALLVALVSLSACSSSSNPAMSGTWLFALTPINSSSPVLEFTTNLTQIGSQITGQITLTGNAASCGSAASMSGTLMGNTLTLQLNQIDSAIDFSGTVNPEFTAASGTYTGAAGSCLLDSGFGSWSAALE